LGSSQYIVTSPLFSHALIQRDNGAKIDITASNNQLNNKYISSASLDEKSFNDVYIRQSDLLKGNHTLSYTMSPTPTS
jgi:putative alpha-1,2-mannosidase